MNNYITLLLAVLIGAVSSEHYHLVPVDSPALCQHFPNGTCFTLHQFSSQISHTGDIIISFLPGQHFLTWNNMIFFRKSNLTLNSEQLDNHSNSAPTIKCVSNKRIGVIETDIFTLEGLVISNCQSKYGQSIYEGGVYLTLGAVYLKKTTAVIKNCVFKNNSAVCEHCRGGALYSEDSNITIDSCVFSENSASQGGGMYIMRSLPDNSAANDGGACRVIHVVNSIFEHNRAELDGGAVYVLGILNVTNSIFEHNACTAEWVGIDGGGAVFVKGALNVTNSIFGYNRVESKGGATSVQGTLNVSNSTFKHNKAEHLGGAIYMYDKGILNVTNSIFQYNMAANQGGAVMMSAGESMIIGSMFEYNTANKGGALFTISTSQTLNVTFSTFQHNTAILGGAVFAYSISTIIASAFQRNTAGDKNNTVITNGGGALFVHGTSEIISSVFKYNMALNSNGGAVAAMGKGTVTITNSTFSSNQAFKGGAIISGEKVLLNQPLTITMDKNIADYGGAMYLERTELQCGSTFGEYFDLIITSNRAKQNGGGVYAVQSRINLDEGTNTNIYNNTALHDGGGIYLTAGSSLRFDQSKNLFDSNTATHFGGGIYLQDKSQILLIPPQFSIIMRLEHNTAKRGGAIYVSDSGSGQVRCDKVRDISESSTVNECFIQAAAFKQQIFVANNSVKETGSDIYGGLLDRCIAEYQSESGVNFMKKNIAFSLANRIIENISQFFNHTSESLSTFNECFIQAADKLQILAANNSVNQIVSDIYGGLLDRCIIESQLGVNFMKKNVAFSWANRKIENISQLFNHISSDPVRVCFCQNNVADCDYTHPTVHKKKGETFTLSVAAVDQVGKPVIATLISSFLSKDGRIERLKEGQQRRPVNDSCTELEYNVYSQEHSIVLAIYADGPCGNWGISKKEVNITFEPCTCPIGLEKTPDPIDCSCDCALELKQHISNCSPENKTIQINENIWIEYINSTSKFVTHQCPIGYCVPKPVNISLTNQTEADKQCAFNRAGRLCGQCAQGLSLVFASSKCQQCSNYYLFLLLPFALAGIALVAFIMLLNMTVATGTIHGLIFYANILAANRSVFLPFNSNFLTVFISWLNLDLGIETCFYNGMDSYGKFLLQLVFPVYVFILVAIIMVLCNCSTRVAHLFGKKNPEATLYTLILLSYSKLIRLIITALQNAQIDYPGQKLFWLYDANVSYFYSSHYARFLAAFIIIILGAVYTTLLLFGQLFNCCSEHRLMKKLTTHRYYIHFMKAHHAPLSKKHRYWVGLLLLVRLVHYLISAFTDDSTAILSVGSLTIFLLLHKINRIYKNWLLNTLETIFITNLNILALATFYVGRLNLNASIQETHGDQQALATVSMSISFITFLAIVVYHILNSCGVMLGELPNKILTALREHRHNQTVVVIEEREANSYKLLDQHELREPALDDLIRIRPEDYNRPPTPPPQCGEPTFSEVDIRAEQTHQCSD